MFKKPNNLEEFLKDWLEFASEHNLGGITEIDFEDENGEIVTYQFKDLSMQTLDFKEHNS